MKKSKEWVSWQTFIKPTTCFECFRRNSKIFSYEELAKIGEPKLHERCGCRNRQRIVFSNDGLVFVTYDHYKTFMEIIGEER